MSEHSPHAAQDVAHSPTALAERAQHKIALNNLTLSGFALLFLGAVYANYVILQPYFSAFFWGAALSIPLHLVKTSLVTSLSVALVDENLSFPFLAITVLPRVVVEVLLGTTIRRWFFELWDQFTAEAKEKQGEPTKVVTTSSTAQPHDIIAIAAAEAYSSIQSDDLIRSLAGTDVNPLVPAWPYFILVIRLCLMYLALRDLQLARYLASQAIRASLIYVAYRVTAKLGGSIAFGWIQSVRVQTAGAVRANLEALVTAVLVLLTLVVGGVSVWFVTSKVIDEAIRAALDFNSVLSDLSFPVMTPAAPAQFDESFMTNITLPETWILLVAEYQSLWNQLSSQGNSTVIATSSPLRNLSTVTLIDVLAVLPVTRFILAEYVLKNRVTDATLMNAPLYEVLSPVIQTLTEQFIKSIPFIILGSTLLAFLDIIWQLILFLSTLQFFLSRPHPINHIVSRLFVLLDPTGRFSKALNLAVSGTLSATLQLILLHGLWTWLTLSVAGVPFVYLHVLASVAIAILPVASPVVVVIPAVLGFVFTHLWRGLALLVAHVWFAAVVDPLVYSVIPRAHPFFIGLGILMGKWAFGWPGLVIAPVVMTCTPVAYDLLVELME